MTSISPAQRGTLIVIGGHEDKDGDKIILKAVADALPIKRLIIATIASHEPEGYFDTYQRAFAGLGLTDLSEVYINDRAEAGDPKKIALFDEAGGVFFSGGDQLRISSQIGDTPLEQKVKELYERGGVIAGTSAGASAVAETMLVRGASEQSHRVGDLHLAPGLGLVRDVIIDQHFAERGRIGRLLGAVAFNPRMLGIGVDENTAALIRNGRFDVIGAGAVYVVDAAGVTQSNIAEAQSQSALSLFDVRMHVLSSGDRFDLRARRPATAASLHQSHALEQRANTNAAS